MARKELKIKEFELKEPVGYKDMILNADRIYADLLLRYYEIRQKERVK